RGGPASACARRAREPRREVLFMEVSKLRRRDTPAPLPRRQKPRVDEAQGAGDPLGEELADRTAGYAAQDLAEEDVPHIGVDDFGSARVLRRKRDDRPEHVLA